MVTAILSILLQLIPMVLQWIGASVAVKSAYVDFLHAIENDADSSAKLRLSALAQRDRITQQIAADTAKQTKV